MSRISLVVNVVLALILCQCYCATISFGNCQPQPTQIVYVDGVHGSNSNNGSESSPFQTLNYTLTVLCSNVNPNYIVVMSPVSNFVYQEFIEFVPDCATLSVNITSINPADKATIAKEATSNLLDIQMAQISWSSPSVEDNPGAILSLTFDHIAFVGAMNLIFMPSVDLGDSWMYSLTMQNCVFPRTTGSFNSPTIMINSGDHSALQSPIEFRLSDSIIQQANLLNAFLFTAGVTPVYVYVSNTQFEKNVFNDHIFDCPCITVLVVDGCEFHNNSVSNYLIFSQGLGVQAQSGPLQPAFNFTNNIVDGNSFELIIFAQGVEGKYLVDFNKITNNLFENLDWNSDASSTFDDAGVNEQPFVISNNVFSCNEANSSYVAFFIPRGENAPWSLINNTNGDAINCPIEVLPGFGFVDSINIQPCPPGYYGNSSVGIDSQCVPCDPGTYNSNYAASSCTPCPPGAFASAAASQSCSLCSPGTHARGSGSSSCANCNSGYFASRSGEILCERCAAGTCTPSSGAWMVCQRAPCANVTQSAISLE